MKAGVFYAPGDVRYEEIPVPDVGPGELLIAVDTALTCGTDLKCYRRGHPVLLSNLPSPFGHEFAGRIVKMGEGITAFKIGNRVVAANSAPCYACFYCSKQQYNLCENLVLLNGCYADYIKIPAVIAQHNTYVIPDHLPFEIAAFTEPLAVSLRGVDMCHVQPGDRVAVMGTGPIGQLLMKVAVLKGACVTAFGRNPDKLALAQTFGGAAQTVSLLDFDCARPDEVRRLLDQYTPSGRGFDVVIEAIGLPKTWEQALSLVRKGGLVNLFAGCESGTSIQVDTRRLHYDEITMLSLFHHTPAHVQEALAMLSDGRIDPRPLISKTMPMAFFETALQQMEAGQVLKIALKNSEA